MLQSIVAWMLFACLALAREHPLLELPVSGARLPGYTHGSRQGYRTFARLGREPNATVSTTFKRPYKGSEETWTWRINVTEVAVPDVPTQLGQSEANYTEGLLLSNTQWQLGWPGDDELAFGELSDERGLRADFTAIRTRRPEGMGTDGELKNDGDCSAILGDKCANSLRQAAEMTNSPVLSDEWDSKHCGNTFKGAKLHGNMMFTIETPDPEFDGEDPITSEDTIYFSTSETYKPGNTTVFDQSVGALHIMIMGFKAKYGEPEDESGLSILCMIVDPSVQLAVPEDEDAAVGWRQPLGLVGAMVALSLVVML